MRKIHSFCATAALSVGLACGGGPGTTDGGTGSTSGSAGSTGEPATTNATTGVTTSDGGTMGQTGGTTAEPGSTGGTTTTATTTTSATTTTTSATGSTSEASTGGSTGPGLCDDFVEPGCINSGCPENQMCDTQEGCVPSACSCDPQTGEIACTPDCNGGTCVCAKPACDLFCEFGFKKDMNGCEICECNEGPDCGCASDDDCVKASPGCCACNMGGTEVAIAKACIDQLEKCPLPPDMVFCPAVYKCTDAQAVCVNGACVLQ